MSAETLVVEDAATLVEAVQQAVSLGQNLRPCAGGSKRPLSHARADEVALDLSHLAGILEYRPEEYTVTARAATPLWQLQHALAEHGQYMPFDPILVSSGATLGGTIAAAADGPGSIRYGGMRDFLLGIGFVDGTGSLARAGSRVVKNAAGFDLPKLLVGAVGSLAVLTEATFKVFPCPRAWASLEIRASDAHCAIIHDGLATGAVGSSAHELHGLAWLPASNAASDGVSGAGVVIARLGGFEAAVGPRLDRLADSVLQYAREEGASIELRALEAREEAAVWAGASNLSLEGAGGHAQPVDRSTGRTTVRVVAPVARQPEIDEAVRSIATTRRWEGAARRGWLSVSAARAGELLGCLERLGVSGLLIHGEGEGSSAERFAASGDSAASDTELLRRVRQGLDPDAVLPPPWVSPVGPPGGVDSSESNSF